MPLKQPRRIRADVRAFVRGEPLAIFPAVLAHFWNGQAATYDDFAASLAATLDLIGRNAEGDLADGGAASEIGAPDGAGDKAAVDPRTERAVARKDGAIQVIPVIGAITNRETSLEEFGMATSCARLSRLFAAAVNDDQIKAIVFDMDTPGGTGTGVHELAEQIEAARGRKPIVAQVGGACASAGYWIAAACDEICARQSDYVGSIGVFSVYENIAGMLEQQGIEITVISAGDGKADDMGFGPMSDAARTHLQQRVDDLDNLFTADVARMRGKSQSEIKTMGGRGRVYLGGRAKTIGLIDKIRSMNDTLAAYGVAGRPAGGPSASAAKRRRELTLIERR